MEQAAKTVVFHAALAGVISSRLPEKTTKYLDISPANQAQGLCFR
jgi:hypothetical protein